jgi:Uma2 family endonuclease
MDVSFGGSRHTLALTKPGEGHLILAMDTVLDRPWSTEQFLAWEDQQEGKNEFDGFRVVPMTGGSIAHQVIVFNLLTLFARLLTGTSLRALHEMRIRIGPQIRYPDVLVYSGPLKQTLKTLNDAIMIFEVLSDDTAASDRVAKLIDYANVPSLQYYIMLEQASCAAIVNRRETAGTWTAAAQTEGAIALPELNLILPLEEIYQGLTFDHQPND